MEQERASHMPPPPAAPQRFGTPAAAVPLEGSEDDWMSAARPASPSPQPPAAAAREDVLVTPCSPPRAWGAKLPRAANIFRKRVAGAEAVVPSVRRVPLPMY